MLRVTTALSTRARRASIILVVALACAAAFPRAQASAPFFFLQFSDPQFGYFTADKDFAQETVNFQMAIATANRLKPAFVIVTGDLVNKPGDAAQIAEYRRIASTLDKSIPLYNVAGNHDVENALTPDSVAAYRKTFGPDYYTVRHESLAGIVLNSSLIHSPDKAAGLPGDQEVWLLAELTRLQQSGARHRIVFQHHPWFLKAADEPDQYFNIPLVRRSKYLDLFQRAGVRTLISGHYHRNALASAGGMEMITTGPVGKPSGDDPQSGLRVFIVRDDGLSHRFYPLSNLPNAIDLNAK